MKFIWIIFKDSTTQSKYFVSVTEIKQLMLFTKTIAFYVKIWGNTQIYCVGKVLYETQMCERVFGPWNDPRFKNTKTILKTLDTKSIHLHEAEKRSYIRGPSGANYFSKQPAKCIEKLLLSVLYATWNSV